MDNEKIEQKTDDTAPLAQGVQIPRTSAICTARLWPRLSVTIPISPLKSSSSASSNAQRSLAAGRNLRLTEIARFKAKNGQKSIAHYLFPLTSFFPKLKIKALLKTGKLEEALVAAERLLLIDPLDLSTVRLFSEIAIQAGYVADGMMTMEIVSEHLPTNSLAVTEVLGRLYYKARKYRKARECLERVHRAKPNDAAIAHMLKDSEALATLDSGWEDANKGGDYRGALKSKEESDQLEKQSKMVKTADDADSLITEALQKIEADPKNINYYLNLVGLYSQQKRFDEALGTITKARELIGADAELDRRFSNITIAKFDAEITALKDVGEDAAAQAKETERNQYVFDDIADRVARYPNDQHLRYELGLQYYKYGHLDDAVQQLQIAQKNPKDRVSALYHLALCFRSKGLLDMAVAQLEQALEFLPTMNTEKMDIYYLMGEICLEEGKSDDAAKYFKEIYRVDVTYREISKYIENIYAAQKKAKEVQ